MSRPPAPPRPTALAGATVVVILLPLAAWLVLVAVDAPSWGRDAVAGLGLVGLAGLVLRERARGDRRARAAAGAERQLAAERATIVQLMAYELRTPLTTIRGGVETIVERVDVDPSLTPVAEAVQLATERVEGLLTHVQATLDQFEIEEHERIGTPLEAVIEGVVQELPARQQTRVRVAVTAVAGVETHVGRRGIVALLLHTVLDNALKFSPPQAPVDVRGHVSNDEVVLEVVDRGPGLAPDFATRAFEVLARGEQEPADGEPGLGMGLFTARRVTTRLGGSIVLTDGPDGVGCVAEIRLPRGFTTRGRDAAASEPTDREDLARR